MSKKINLPIVKLDPEFSKAKSEFLKHFEKISNEMKEYHEIFELLNNTLNDYIISLKDENVLKPTTKLTEKLIELSKEYNLIVSKEIKIITEVLDKQAEIAKRHQEKQI